MDRVLWCRQLVMGELLGAHDLYEARMAERGEMTRHVRLRQLQQIDDVAYAELARGQYVQDPKARGIGECFK